MTRLGVVIVSRLVGAKYVQDTRAHIQTQTDRPWPDTCTIRAISLHCSTIICRIHAPTYRTWSSCCSYCCAGIPPTVKSPPVLEQKDLHATMCSTVDQICLERAVTAPAVLLDTIPISGHRRTSLWLIVTSVCICLILDPCSFHVLLNLRDQTMQVVNKGPARQRAQGPTFPCIPCLCPRE